jgi:hypothetical protein
MQFYLYADPESVEALSESRPKALLIGSDFGYGNFGDVLQHIGAASRIREAGISAISVLTLDAIGRHTDVPALRRGYGVNALVFVSTAPVEPEVARRLGVRRVETLCNVSCVQLYGGGFLNKLWGDFVLSVAEFFLERLPGATYVVSGQQVSPGYEDRVREHVAKFQPVLLGLRDHDSLGRMLAQGMDVNAEYSFDDAVEPLFALNGKLQPRKGDGAFVHLNTSGYTGNSDALSEIGAHLEMVVEHAGSQRNLVLFQAFQDAREDVIDSIETVKRLEAAFPFVNMQTVLLMAAVTGKRDASAQPIVGRFGYCSSYHVTLWLQLNGVPTWLRGSNEYYRQKRKALGIEGGFEAFLERMQVPEHGENLDARSRWTARLDEVLDSIGPVKNALHWPATSDASTRTFHFKGEPSFAERLDEVWRANKGLHERLISSDAQIADLGTQLESSQQRGEQLTHRLGAMVDQVSQLGAECHELRTKLDEAAKQLMDNQTMLVETEARMQAYSEQLTVVGDEARQYHDQYTHAQAGLESTSLRERELSERLQVIMTSRSWRWTRPIRAINRFLSSGRFDSAGDLGVFGVTQAVGRRMPLPQSWKSGIGSMLVRFRRR